MRYYAETVPGIEEIAWLEIRERLPQARFEETLFIKEKRGLVLFAAAHSPAEMLLLRSVESVFAHALSIDKLTRSRRDLYAISEQIATSAQFGTAVDTAMAWHKQTGKPTYHVTARHLGRNYQYNNSDLVRSVQIGLEKRYPNWEPVPRGARVELHINVMGSRLLCGFQLTAAGQHQSYRAAVELTGMIRPSIAAAMVQLTQPEATDVFLDPIGNKGLFLMERRLVGPYRQLIAAGSDALTIENNLRAQRKEPPQNTAVLTDTTGIDTGAINKIATLLPDMKAYESFLAEVARLLAGNGRAVVMALDYDKVREALRQVPELEILTGYSVMRGKRWGRIYILQRNA